MKSTLILTILVIIFDCQGIQTLFSIRYPDPWTNVRIYFYYGNGNQQETSYQLKDGNQLLKHPNFDINYYTTLYVHGYNETQQLFSIPTLRTAYSYRKDYNFITLDYSLYVKGNIMTDYVWAFKTVPYLAPFVSQALIKLFDAGLSIEKFHLVGHSLGGQLSGHIGRNLIEQSGATKILNRISGLDPAFPGFYILPLIEPIKPSDAKFVDIIHTDAFIYGAPTSTGSVDFWPNGGKALQPGCPTRHYFASDANDFCSHWRSWKYWAESVSDLYQEKFVAYKANSYPEFTTRSLISYKRNEVSLMGLQASIGSRGNFYLNTNANTPYSRTNLIMAT